MGQTIGNGNWARVLTIIFLTFLYASPDAAAGSIANTNIPGWELLVQLVFVYRNTNRITKTFGTNEFERALFKPGFILSIYAICLFRGEGGKNIDSDGARENFVFRPE